MISSDPIITEDSHKPFVIHVKLLTNEVFDFQIDKNMKVSDFKTLISPKVNVPVDKMRIVFSGKQLLDEKLISDYVSESGMTVHLIAKSAPPPEQSNPQPASQPAQGLPNRPQQQGIPGNPFGDIMGMVNSLFVNPGQQGPAPQITMSFGNLAGGPNNNNPLAGILGGLGNLGMMMPPPQPVPSSSS